MSFLKSVKLAARQKNALWSLLWVGAPLANTVSLFFFAGFLVRLIRQCHEKSYVLRYGQYGLLFVQGVFACAIALVYLLPALVVVKFSVPFAVVLAFIGALFASAGVARFAVTDEFMSAFGAGIFRVLGGVRFWLAFGVWAAVAGVSGVLCVALMVVSLQTMVVPVALLAAWIVGAGLLGAAMLGHAQN